MKQSNRIIAGLLFVALNGVAFQSNAIEEVLVTGSACAFCVGSAIESQLRSDMDSAAAAAEAQRAIAAQMAAQRAAAEAAKQKSQCGSMMASIRGGQSGCEASAKIAYSKSIAGCPSDTEVFTELNVAVGLIRATTTPRQTCIENYVATKDATLASCEAKAAIALGKLPAYCY
jgi:hypothetical protein